MPRTTFFIDDPVGRNGIQVLSLAPLETILVRTNNIAGEVEIDTVDILRQPSVRLSVPVDSLDTGIPLMNEVLRSDRWLDAAKFPTIRFSLDKVLSPAMPTGLANGTTIVLEAMGTVELHGASNPCPIRGDLTWLRASERTARRLPGDLLHLRARFDLRLPDYGIESHLSPQSLDKVAGTLQVEANLFASTERPQVPDKMRQELARARRELAERLLRS
ncbi:MAG: YceI family protein [Candidatus Rokubacteria bacterium]|nr:YceI family protein [Candidatus Rokubacteria bacterium]